MPPSDSDQTPTNPPLGDDDADDSEVFVIKPLRTKERQPIALLETHSEQSLACSISPAAPPDTVPNLVGVCPEQSASAPDLSEVRAPSKGKSSAKNPPKASKSSEPLGRMTRGREKRMREEEELVRAGMEKLVTTGKALAGFSDLEDTQPSFSKPTRVTLKHIPVSFIPFFGNK